MSMTLDGIEYTIDQPTDNALNLLNYINTYLTSIGSAVQFIVNAASPIWLIILGMGYMLSIYQKAVYAAGQAFSIADCSELQVLNLAEIAGTAPLSGSETIITCRVTASGGDCVITTALTKTLQYEGSSVVFHPIYDITIASGITETVTLQATTVGPMYIGVNAVTSFDTVVPNLSVMTSSNAAPGSLPETPAGLRVRLQKNENLISGINACINAIRNLAGVQTANLYFNTDLTLPLIIETMTIPPRSCGLFVQGYSDFLAETYFLYMSAPCLGGTQTQTFTTEANQLLPITYSLPNQVDIYIKVTVRIPESGLTPAGYQDGIKLLLIPASNSQLIGKDYTQSYLLPYLSSYNVPDITIVGLSVSTDNMTFSDTTDLLKNQIGIILSGNISFTEIM